MLMPKQVRCRRPGSSNTGTLAERPVGAVYAVQLLQARSAVIRKLVSCNSHEHLGTMYAWACTICTSRNALAACCIVAGKWSQHSQHVLKLLHCKGKHGHSHCRNVSPKMKRSSSTKSGQQSQQAKAHAHLTCCSCASGMSADSNTLALNCRSRGSSC